MSSTKTRVLSVDEQTHELHSRFASLNKRIREFNEAQTVLADLRVSVAAIRGEIASVKTQLETVKRALPGVARKEEIERFRSKLEAMHFELYATERTLRGARVHFEDDTSATAPETNTQTEQTGRVDGARR